MLENLLDPAVLCFVAGVLAGVLRSDLRIPEALYETLSIYLLLTIGLKGGVQLATADLGSLVAPVGGTFLLGLVVPCVAFVILRHAGRFDRSNAAAIAAHYGSVSAVTFAVATEYVGQLGLFFEETVTVLLVVLEVPAIGVGIAIARMGVVGRRLDWKSLAHELLLGKSIYLLLAGLAIGWLAGPERMQGVSPLFFGLFKGALALFLLEMGLVASRRLRELRSVGAFLVVFGVLMPVASAFAGIAVGWMTGLSVGGTGILATLAASASYIAAPAAMRIAVPEANPTFYLVASLGITFPFNIVFGIPLYVELTRVLFGAGG